MKEASKFYESSIWRKKREQILRKYGYVCQESKRYGRYDIADTVHHIFPREEYPELALVDWNLIPLTNKQHNKMHDRDNNMITALGKQWQDRRRKEFNAYMSSKNDTNV